MKQIALELQPCIGSRSGIGMYTYELAKRLRSDNLLSFRGNVFNFRGKNNLSQEMSGVKLPLHTCTALPYGVYRRVWHMFPVAYETFFPGADLTVFFNFIVPPQIRGKVITTVYDLTYVRYPQTMDPKNLHRISKDIRYSTERSDRIITISEFSKREIHQVLGVPLEKISVLYSAASFSDQTTDKQNLFSRYGINRPYLLYVGNMEPRKNLVRMVQAYKLLKKDAKIPHQLLLAGGSGWRNEELHQELRTLEATGDVIRTGYVTEEEKNTLYSHAGAFVFPSLYEGFGMPPLEAMHFGCPVICADAASLPEVVGDAAELVDPMEVESIAAGMLRVLTDTAHRTDLVQKGYIQTKKFTWEDSANKLMQICREVLEES